MKTQLLRLHFIGGLLRFSSHGKVVIVLLFLLVEDTKYDEICTIFVELTCLVELGGNDNFV